VGFRISIFFSEKISHNLPNIIFEKILHIYFEFYTNRIVHTNVFL
jgi:hypothetical protein